MTTIRILSPNHPVIEINSGQMIITVHHGSEQHSECFILTQAQVIRALKNYTTQIDINNSIKK